MSRVWYPGMPEPTFEIDVDDPGYGRFWIRRLDVGERDVVDVVGEQLGQLLDAVTDAVLDDTAPRLPWRLARLELTTDEARLLLRPLQQAVLLAGAGTERYERHYVDPDDRPAEPLCVHCNLGSPYSGAVTISERCNEFGHVPYGEHPGARWPTHASAQG